MIKGAIIFNKITRTIDKVYLYAAAFFAVALLLVSVWQVFTRYILQNPASWTDEIARYTFIWCNMLGAAACVRDRSHATVSIVHDLIPKTARKWYNMVMIHFAEILFGILMIYVGYRTTVMQIGKVAAISRLPMSLVYVSVLVSGIGITIQATNNILWDMIHPEETLADAIDVDTIENRKEAE